MSDSEQFSAGHKVYTDGSAMGPASVLAAPHRRRLRSIKRKPMPGMLYPHNIGRRWLNWVTWLNVP